MAYQAIGPNGKVLRKGDILRDFRGSVWIYQSVTHPRKINVMWKDDPNGPDSWPNKTSREFYASVFNAGIRHVESQVWTFPPEGDNPALKFISTQAQPNALGYAELGESDVIWD